MIELTEGELLALMRWHAEGIGKWGAVKDHLQRISDLNDLLLKLDWPFGTESAPLMEPALKPEPEGTPIPPLPPQKAMDAPLPAPVEQDPPREKTPQRAKTGRPRGLDKLTTYQSVLDKPRRDARRAERVAAAGILEPSGYRPPTGTVEKVLADDKDKPVFDRGRFGEYGATRNTARDSKVDLHEQLRAAVLNTAPPPDDEE